MIITKQEELLMKAVVVNPESTGVEIIQNKELRPLETGEALVEIEYCGV